MEECREKIASTHDDIRNNEDYFAQAREQLAEVENLLQNTPAQRVEEYYQSLMDRKRTVKGELELSELAEQFHEMEGYKDAEALAAECESMVLKMHYDQLLEAKSRASSENDYIELAQQFRKMNGYANTNDLADECGNIALKMRYDQLLEAKSGASSENDYIELAQQFRKMNGYADTKDLADECENIALKIRYDQLLDAKSRASTEDDYLELSQQFRTMNGYKDTETLAAEYDNRYQACKEHRLAEERLVREKPYNDAVAEFRQLNEQLYKPLNFWQKYFSFKMAFKLAFYKKMAVDYERLYGIFKTLAENRRYGEYEDATYLADQCDKGLQEAMQKKGESLGTIAVVAIGVI